MPSHGCVSHSATCKLCDFFTVKYGPTRVYSRFMKALAANGMSRDDLPYKAPFQPWGSWFALIATGIITFFKGFDTFLPFTVDTFVT